MTAKGFTLLEMVVVLAIISIILGGAVGVMKGITNSIRDDKVYSDFTTIEALVLKYQISNGNYPTTKQGLAALVSKPVSGPVSRRWSKIAEAVPKDPWGSDYGYRYPGSVKPEYFELISAGKDRIPGTDDDFSSQGD